MARRDFGWMLACAAAFVALALGVYARLKGLGAPSIAPDEYYTVQSVGNVLRFGLPAYACGGYYPRALAFQYAAALWQLVGGDGLLAVRGLAAVSSLIALPGIYLLGRRIGGRVVGLAVLALLAVSLWEVEIARFGRMYASFQAVTVWYLVFFLKYAVDGERRALLPMLLLTLLGALTWEGGVFLPLVNLLVPFMREPAGRLSRADVLYLLLNVMLLALAYVLATTNLRTLAVEPAFPAGYDPGGVRMPGDVLDDTRPLWQMIGRHSGWILLAIVPIGLALAGLKWIWNLRQRWPASVAALAALSCALAHQFAAVVVILVLALLLRVLEWRELVAREARGYWIAIAALLIFWLAFGALTSDWQGSLGIPWLGDHPLLWLLYRLFRLPDVGLQILSPWLHAAPELAFVLAVLILIELWKVMRDADQSAERAALLALVCMAAAVGLSHPPRQETRYVFFLYPLIMALSVMAVGRVLSAFKLPHPREWGALAALLLFALSTDFRPSHLLAIDGAEASMRLDLPHKLETHVVLRTDVRGAVQWLQAQAAQAPGALFINAYPGADYYFRHFDFTFIRRGDQRFRAFACRRGSYDRWGNLPLVSTLPELEQRILGRGRAYLVIDRDDWPAVASALHALTPRLVWNAADGDLQIWTLVASGMSRAATSDSGG